MNNKLDISLLCYKKEHYRYACQQTHIFCNISSHITNCLLLFIPRFFITVSIGLYWISVLMLRCVLRYKSTSCASLQFSLNLGFPSYLSSFIAVKICKLTTLAPGSPCIFSNLTSHPTVVHVDCILLAQPFLKS